MPTSQQKIAFIQGTPHFTSVQKNTTPGVTQELFSFTVSGTELRLYQLMVTTRYQAVFYLYSDSAIIASGRIGAGENNVKFVWDIPRAVLSGKVLKLEIDVLSGKPITEVEAYLQASQI